MVEIVAYQECLLPALHRMLESQDYMGVADITHKTLPRIGFVAIDWVQDDKGIPTAAGFLRLVEGGFAQIDTLMSNSLQSQEKRHEGISNVIESLLSEAKKLNLIGILAFTSRESTILRAKALGFHIVEGHQVIAMSLKERI